MDYTSQNLVTITLILLTGLSAGLCFTWSNAVTTGIGKLDDLSYLSAFQQMNRSIINPLFIIVFFGPLFAGLTNIYLFKNESGTMIWLLIIAVALYFFGVILVTIFGNVPLNEILDKTNLEISSIQDLKQLRERFESKWNVFHLVRTITSAISFLVLITITVINTNN